MQKSEKKFETQYEVPPVFLEVYTGEEPFSFKAFKQFIIDCGIRYPDIVIAQAIQESSKKGKFNSDIWHENNNPFGMKVAKQRNTTSIGVNRGHAKFKNWKMAVLDYAYMQAVFARKVKTRNQYYAYLRGYARDEKYPQKLQKIIRDYKGFGISTDYLNDL
jgi:flagellum-specific peptidoglycan hydrolase FlgJ